MMMMMMMMTILISIGDIDIISSSFSLPTEIIIALSQVRPKFAIFITMTRYIKNSVVAYISDNENKMKITRQLLETHYKEVDARGHNLGLLVYGCAAHYLNLVEKEVTPRTVLSHFLLQLQSDSCSLGDAVQIWFEVLEDPVLQPFKALIQARFDDWITPFQLVAYATHPKYQELKFYYYFINMKKRK
ncbi:hypothetical protein Avbf_13417 [Armadillidium vulgare]|nr:hypothetical protein Avbf_13417 [Armadillidium vulgare]